MRFFTNYSELEGGDVDGVYEYAIAPQLHEFAASVFEDICGEYVREMQKANALPFRYSQMGRWWGKRQSDEKMIKEKCRKPKLIFSLFPSTQRSIWSGSVSLKISHSDILNIWILLQNCHLKRKNLNFIIIFF